VSAIREGRQLFTNLQASFKYLLMIHLPLVLTATLIPLAGYPLLYLPVHIIWLELIIHPTALLVFQEIPAGGELRRVERGARIAFFSPLEWATIIAVGSVVTVVVGATYLRSLGAGFDVEHGRAMAMVVLTAASAGITASLTRLRGPAARAVVFSALVLAVVLVQTPGVARLLHLAPLHADDWILALAGGLAASLITIAGSVGRGHTLRARPQ
jgi:Ca2+-transporting ATPase